MIPTQPPGISLAFDAVFRRLSMPALVVARSSQVIAVNEAAAALFVLPTDKLIGQFWAGLDARTNLILWRQRLKEIDRSEVLHYETDLISNHSRLRPAEVEVVPVGEDLLLITLRDRLGKLVDRHDLEALDAYIETGFWAYNGVDREVYFSDYARRLLDLPGTRLDPATALQHLSARIHPEDWRRRQPQWEGLRAAPTSLSQVITYDSEVGSRRLRISCVSTGNDLQVTRVFGLVTPEEAPSVSGDFSLPGELAAFGMDHVSDLIICSDAEDIIVYVNQPAEEYFGYSAKELVGRPFTHLLPAPSPDYPIPDRQTTSSSKYLEATYRVLRQGGVGGTMATRNTFLRLGGREYTYTIARPAEDLSLEERLLRLSIENARDMVFWTRADGTFAYVNKIICEKLGYGREELIDAHASLVSKQYTEENAAAWWANLRREGNSESEWRIEPRVGDQIVIRVAATYLNYNGTEYACSICRDITVSREQRKQLELARLSIEDSSEMIVWSQPGGELAYTNRAVREKLGYTARELSTMSSRDIIPDFSDKWWRAIWEQIRREKHIEIRSKNQTKDGRMMLVQSSMSYLRFGEEEYLCSINRDVTEEEAKRLEIEEANDRIRQLSNRLKEENVLLREESAVKYDIANIITISPKYQKVLEKISMVANVDTTVLITGETGTGKELLARALHQLSHRAEYPLIKVNCAALPENLIESELFGHEKGAFTGATARRKGRFELANKGTLFLDEVGELPLQLQSKLLRVLQEGEFERLGGTDTLKVDVRLVTATNRNLEKMVEKGTFRSDLYYRLKVFPVQNMALRDRPEDIPILVRHFVAQFAKRMNKQIREINGSDLLRLRNYAFPGNIRELENIVERAVVLCQTEVLSIPFEVEAVRIDQDGKLFLGMDEMQRQHIISALRLSDGTVSGPNGAGKLLKMKDQTLISRIKKLGIKKTDYLK